MYCFYEVKPGDQIFQILRDAYGPADFRSRRNDMIAFVLANNPNIKNINNIYPGQIILLPVDSDPQKRICSVSQLPAVIDPGAVEKLSLVPETLKRMSAEGRELAWTFGGETLQKGGDSFVRAVNKSVTSALPDLRRIPLEYFRKEAGVSTVGKYNYARTKNIRSIEKKLGFLEPLVFNTKKATEVLRIDKQAPNRIHHYIKALDDFDRIGKVAKFGGAIVKAIDVVSTAHSFSMAEKKEDKIGIVADWAGGLAAGLAFTLLVATPVGWTGLAVVAIGGAVAGMAGGAAAETIAEGILAGNWKSPLAQLMD